MSLCFFCCHDSSFVIQRVMNRCTLDYSLQVMLLPTKTYRTCESVFSVISLLRERFLSTLPSDLEWVVKVALWNIAGTPPSCLCEEASFDLLFSRTPGFLKYPFPQKGTHILLSLIKARLQGGHFLSSPDRRDDLCDSGDSRWFHRKS